MNTRNLFATLLVVVILLALFEAAKAQAPAAPPALPASAASAATSLAPTPDTACGAAGTGYVWRYEPGATRRTKSLVTLADQGAKPGAWAKRVDRAGDVVACRMPSKSAKPKDCPPMPAPSKWAGEHGRQCAPNNGAMLPGRNIGPADVTVWSQGYFDANPAPGQRKGKLTYECRPEGWTLIGSYCQ